MTKKDLIKEIWNKLEGHNFEKCACCTHKTAVSIELGSKNPIFICWDCYETIMIAEFSADFQLGMEYAYKNVKSGFFCVNCRRSDKTQLSFNKKEQLEYYCVDCGRRWI